MLFALLAALLGTAPEAAADANPVTTVILVRHAEKTTARQDPALTPRGSARANELARVLADVKLDAIYTTPYQRTRMTAAPVAARAKLVPVEVMAAAEAYATELVSTIRQKHVGGTVLVVGHSNTTPEVLKALGIADPVTIEDGEYDRLFIVTLTNNAPPRMLALRFGAVSRR